MSDGVKQTLRKGKRLTLQYDDRRINISTIEAELGKSGLPPTSTLAWRYVDDTVRVAGGSSGASCCSNPQDIYASRKRKKSIITRDRQFR